MRRCIWESPSGSQGGKPGAEGTVSAKPGVCGGGGVVAYSEDTKEARVDKAVLSEARIPRNEVREGGRGQIREGLVGHDRECGFYPRGNGKPLQVLNKEVT